MAEPATDLGDLPEFTDEEDAYFFQAVISHLHAARNRPGIFELIESCPFLADQVEFLGGFELAGKDLEEHAIPSAVEIVDWKRFLHYASLALNLRGLAESLAEPEILRALARGGRQDLALDIVGRLADPLRRAGARAILASAQEPAELRLQDLLREIEEDLAAAVPTAAALAAIARSLGPELSCNWRHWIARLTAGADEVWAAVAGSWLDRGETRTTGLWEALTEIRDHRLVLGLITRIGEIDQGEIGEIFGKIASLFGEEPISRRRALATFLARQSRHQPDSATAAWECWTAGEPISWTVELIEDCRELLQSLAPTRIEIFFSTLADPEAQAALRVANLEARPDASRTAAALEAVSRLPEGPAKLRWSLRFLEARPHEPVLEVQGQVGAVAAYLHELRYDAAAGDLRRFLDLADRFYPDSIQRLIEDIAWSPASRPETLLTLAAETTRERVADQLLDHAERFASSVSLTEAEGFHLRGALIRRTACRLCLLRRDLKGLGIAAERLLPEEEDELREMLASMLAGADLRKQALEVAGGIQNPRRQFLARLRILPPEEIPGDFLAPRSLYAAMASAQPLEDERLALAALLSKPFDPQELLRQWIAPIRSGELQTQALLRLARHALAFQRSFYGRRQDPTAALEVVRGAIAIETDERLAAFTPEIAALGAEAGPKEAVGEFKEAARQLAELDTLPWAPRADALERLLSQVGPRLLSHGEPERRGTQRVIAVLESVARLPLGPRSIPALDELRSRWHEFLPILIAAADRLSEPLGRSLDGALRQGCSACGEAGGPLAERIVSLCLTPTAGRLELAERLLEEEPAPLLRRALAYLFSSREPERIPDLLRPLQHEVRDELILRLVRFHWVASDKAGLLLSLMTDSTLRREADLWVHLDNLDWLDDLAMLAFLRGVDPSEPGFGEVLDRLWACDPCQSRPLLAMAFVNALRIGGRERGEAVLRLWLHAHLAPALGTERPEVLQRSKEVQHALERSLVLSP